MGLFTSLLSAVLAASKDLVSKRLAFQLDGTASTYASFAYALPFYGIVLAILALLGQETFACSLSFLVLVVLRSVTDTLAEGMKMHAFAHGDISLVASFFSLSPLFLLITSPLITGDPLSVSGTVALVAVVMGSLLLVYRPSERGWREQRTAIFLAAGAALFFSLNSCFDRLAVQEGSPTFAGFAMTVLSAATLLPAVLGRADRQAALREYQGGLWVRGAMEVGFMVAKLTALQYWPAPYVVGIQRLSLVLSIIGGKVFFGEGDFGRRL
ncbi:MAG: EamA family transporter, partial [Planctomycetia bacterium]|nr:EamA family transporter [Planctomycetia bacterium]